MRVGLVLFGVVGESLLLDEEHHAAEQLLLDRGEHLGLGVGARVRLRLRVRVRLRLRLRIRVRLRIRLRISTCGAVVYAT